MSNIIDKAKAIADTLKAEFGDKLSSLHLYGSAARGEYKAGGSDINLLLIFQRLDKDTLKKLSAYQNKYAGKVGLLCLTEDYIRSSTDTFPIELLDMKLRHMTLTGDDLISEISIEPEHLRIQLERELKAKLSLLRQGAIIHGFREKVLKEMMIQHLPALAAVFQGIIFLGTGSAPEKRVDLFEMMAERFALKPELKKTMICICKKERLRFSGKVEDLFYDLIILMENLSKYVDNMEVERR